MSLTYKARGACLDAFDFIPFLKVYVPLTEPQTHSLCYNWEIYSPEMVCVIRQALSVFWHGDPNTDTLTYLAIATYCGDKETPKKG